MKFTTRTGAVLARAGMGGFLCVLFGCAPQPDQGVNYQVLTPNYEKVYDPGEVRDITIQFTSEQWQVLQDFVDSSGPSGFDLDYIYTQADLIYEGQVWPSVGVRFKGNSSYSQFWEKKSFKINFEEYVEGNLFYGLKKLNLNNSFNDPSMMRECLAYSIFAEMGLPSSRCNYINLYIDIGDGKEAQLLGLYANVEQVDVRFLRDRYGNQASRGNLYKPEIGKSGRCSDLSCWTDGASEVDIQKRTNEEDGDYSDIKSFITLIQSLYNNGQSDASRIQSELSQVFNVDLFLRYLAVGNILTNWDSYPSMAHNYYIYNNPVNPISSGKDYWEIIPWDLNQSFGGFTNGATADQLIQWKWCSPGMSAPERMPILVHLVMTVPEWREQYRQHIANSVIAGGVFDPVETQTLAQSIFDLIDPYVRQDGNLQCGSEGHNCFEDGFTTGNSSCFCRWSGPGQYSLSASTRGSSGITSYIRDRVNFLKANVQVVYNYPGDASQDCQWLRTGALGGGQQPPG
ncbi:MAG: CotH kinase family protein, partial [Bdellovibrionales bacterium]|nr:CotH kinase family protein [Bdellovibrionales bacterium]